jgi:hypothetical protein
MDSNRWEFSLLCVWRLTENHGAFGCQRTTTTNRVNAVSTVSRIRVIASWWTDPGL